MTDVDLADVIISLDHKNGIEVYDDHRHKIADGTKPLVGEKLNKPALITIVNYNPRPDL